MKWNPILKIDRIISGKLWKQLLAALFLFFIILFVVASYYTFSKNGSLGDNFMRSFVDMTNPDSLHNEVETNNDSVSIIENRRVWEFAFVYLLGTIVFTGILIATITNIIRIRSNKFRRGTVSYSFKKHIVFLGYNNLVPGIIQKIYEGGEDVRIVVGVEDNASTINDKIKNRLWERFRSKVVTLKADSCNMEDLERLCVPYAEEVYIIGEHDDAYNLKCYRTIYELSLSEPSSTNRMPQCYVNLQSQSTLTLFRTYASAGEIGVDFTNFHAFNFNDEWASMLLLNNSLRFNKKNNECHNHIIIAGMTEMGVFIAQDAVLLCHYPNTHTTILFVDDAAEMRKKSFIAQHQNLFDHRDLLDLSFEFVSGDLSDDIIRKNISNNAEDLSKEMTIAICYDDPKKNITLGLNLPESVYCNNNVRVWVYQPTSSDLGKYLKNSHYKNVITFGMSGDLLDIRNKKNTQIAKRINHYFRRCKENEIDYMNQRLIEMEWEELSIYDRWSCLRRAVFTHVLSQYGKCFPVMIELERRRSIADTLLFGSISKSKSYNDKTYISFINTIYDVIAEHYPDIPQSLNDPPPFYDFKLTDKCPSIYKLYKH